jgi:hypothetical protein
MMEIRKQLECLLKQYNEEALEEAFIFFPSGNRGALEVA